MTCAPTKYDSEPFWVRFSSLFSFPLSTLEVYTHFLISYPARAHPQRRRPYGRVVPLRTEDAPDAFSTMSMPASLERSIRRAQRTRWSFPITAFIASSRVKCVSSKYHSLQSTRAPGASSTRHAPPPAQILSGTGSTTRSIAEARSKCNERSPSPPRALRPPSAPTPASAPNLGLPRTTNATCITAGVPLCGRPPSARNLSAFHHAARRLPITSAGCVCRDDTAVGEQRTNGTEAMHTPRFHQYPHSALGISDKRRWGTVAILGATNACGDSGRKAATSAALRFQIAPRPMQFESLASAASTGKGTTTSFCTKKPQTSRTGGIHTKTAVKRRTQPLPRIWAVAVSRSDFDYFKEKLKSRLSDVKGLFDFDFSLRPHPLRSLHAELPCFEFQFRCPSFDFDFSAPPLLRAPRCLPRGRGCLPRRAAVPAVPSLPASISLSSLPRASLSAVSILDHGHAHGFGYEYTSGDGKGQGKEESGLTPEDALLRADFGRGYEDLPLEWRNNPWIVEGYRFILLTHWPALVCSVFTLHNESPNIRTHFVPMVLLGAAFWGVGLEVPDAWARKWVGEDWARYTVFGAPNPPPPDAAESLFTLFALACLACSALWHTTAGCAHRGAMEACARVDYVGTGWLIGTSIATVVHHGYACAEQVVDATPLGHSILYPSTLLHSGAVEVLQGKAADAVQALMHPSTLLHGADKVVVESGRWVDGVEGGSVLADILAGLASFAAPLRALLGSLSSVAAPPLASLSSPLHPLFNVAASLFAPVLDLAAALTTLVSATSSATSSLAAWPAYHPVGAGCLLLCAAAGVSGNVLPFCDWFNRVENRLWRLALFVGISFSALAPLAGIAALQGWDTIIRFVAPVGPSLLYYIVGPVVYATQVPERFLGGREGWVGWVSDMCGGGSHGIWHIFIVLAMRAHHDGIREMRRAAAEGGCAIRAGPGHSWLRVPFASASASARPDSPSVLDTGWALLAHFKQGFVPPAISEDDWIQNNQPGVIQTTIEYHNNQPGVIQTTIGIPRSPVTKIEHLQTVGLLEFGDQAATPPSLQVSRRSPSTAIAKLPQ
ncbi:hypothetical protein B0H13DRAFT_2320070 [Mycena leptocephala]|nr:hypothetical protein B0H13DRAFT_2320070 [Mycena leptocephala]